ncbi:hypothetical protein WICMUC_001304 [Wickerhamomyces mucosus]|uniref:PHD-type domain-containing protein n=1 Tax=Wickerhamomyces mucosus TaxID=1378264 RepID=A0A9P8PWS6_9ASCO|nr:hypothetical protein WICMUC_001304 [Wickerhamomyces mucosus]
MSVTSQNSIIEFFKKKETSSTPEKEDSPSLCSSENTVLPSSAPSQNSNPTQAAEKSSPSIAALSSSEDSNGRRRRSTRIENEIHRKEQEKIELRKQNEERKKQDEKDKELILKKRKFEESVPLELLQTGGIVPKRKRNDKFEFSEPELAEPIIGVTGLPLASGPSNKIKKESLWPKKKNLVSKSGSVPLILSNEAESGEATPDVNDENESVEQDLKKTLRTTVNEKLQKPSSERTINHKPITKDGFINYGKKSIKDSVNPVKAEPSTPQKQKPSKKEKKRNIKNSSPKKIRENPFGFNNGIQLAGIKRENAFDFNDNTKDNDDFCSSCGEPGIFLCCETCPKSFHFSCCDPPFDQNNLPEDDWYCKECSFKRNPPKPNPPSLFSKLLDQLDAINPVQYRLPKKLRERFEGVNTGPFGEYQDTDQKPYKPDKVGAFEQTDPDLHFDKDGNPIYCVKCGTTGISSDKLNGVPDKLIISCEYCPSSWHLDCLDPPLSNVKQLGTRWKCPNHADHLISKKQRRLKKPHIIDVSQPSGFKNDGNIDVLLNSTNDHVAPGITTPSFFNVHSTQNGVAAEVPKHNLKLWDDSFVVHRLPEKSIVVDFVDSVVRQRSKEKERKINDTWVLANQNNQLLKSMIFTNNYSASERQAVKSLVELQSLDFEELVSEAGKRCNHGETIKVDDLSEEELRDLINIKRLINLKGKASLIEFLQK